MKMTDLLGLGLIAGIGYVVLQGGRELFGALPSITGGLSQAPAVISQTLNPFDYGGDLLSALATYQETLAAYNARIADVEAEIQTRRESNIQVQETGEAFQEDPTPEKQTAFLEAYKTSYEQQLAHIEPGWKPITVEGEVFETAQEWLQGTLQSKGLSASEISFITGGSPLSPDPSPPSGKPAGIEYITDKKVLFDTSVIGRDQVAAYIESLGKSPDKFKWAGGSEGYWWIS